MHPNIRFGKRLLLAVALVLGLLSAPQSSAQSNVETRLAFDVASVKVDNGPFRPPNFPLDNGNAFTPGNRFSADFPLFTYIQFAYKVRFTPQQRESMLAHLPKWVDSTRFAVEAKTAGPATKDQMRLMTQTLLADRFHLAIHFETQETAVMALTLAKPGKTGPKLRPHREGPPCEDVPAQATQARASDAPHPFPERCYVQSLMKKGLQLRAGSRNTTMDQLAEALSGLGRLDRPVVDQTGLSGAIDYELEWTEEPNPVDAPDAAPSPDPGPTFLQALREQLGLKLEPVQGAPPRPDD